MNLAEAGAWDAAFASFNTDAIERGAIVLSMVTADRAL
jgi:hypothetical protein